jgi:hypothetical protein
MKHGNRIKGRDDRSSGIEILMPVVFPKIKPTLLLRCVYLQLHKKRRRPRVKNVTLKTKMKKGACLFMNKKANKGSSLFAAELKKGE